MNVRQVVKGRTMKRVVLEDAATESDDALMATALEAARETKDDIFGYVIHNNGETVVVTLHTD